LIRTGWAGAPPNVFWEGLRSGAATVETVGAADLDTDLGIGKSYRDQDFSIVDRTSFAVMRRLGVELEAYILRRRLRDLSLRTKPPAGLHGGSVKVPRPGMFRPEAVPAAIA